MTSTFVDEFESGSGACNNQRRRARLLTLGQVTMRAARSITAQGRSPCIHSRSYLAGHMFQHAHKSYMSRVQHSQAFHCPPQHSQAPSQGAPHTMRLWASLHSEHAGPRLSLNDTVQEPAAKRPRLIWQPEPSNGSSSELRTSAMSSGSGSGGLSRREQLELLQGMLGYRFRNIDLLAQACTHDSSGIQPSYRQLAFVGDAALWLLFAEHAFKTYGAMEDPIRGAWPAHMSHLLSRANCAATAREWGLDAFLQHSQLSTVQHLQQQEHQEHQQLLNNSLDALPQWDTATSRSSSSDGSSSNSSSTSRLLSTKSRCSGMHAGVWTSDTLAEMFEGLVGALLLDTGSNYEALKQLLQPWVAASFDSSKAAALTAAAAAAAASTQKLGSGAALPKAACGVVAAAAAATAAPSASPAAGCSQHVAVQAAGAAVAKQQQWQQQYQLSQTLSQQLQQVCHYCFYSRSPVQDISGLLLQLLTSGSSCPRAETMRFLGFSILQFTVAVHAYHTLLGGAATAGRQQQRQQQHHQQQQQGDSLCHRPTGDLQQQQQQQPNAGNLLRRISSSSSGSSEDSYIQGSSSCNVVHQMSKYASGLTTVRHRCKMWLWLLDSTPWCPEGAFIKKSGWKRQKQLMSHCLDLLLASVYLDGGLGPAVQVAQVLVAGTPPTTHDKAWIPGWARAGKDNE